MKGTFMTSRITVILVMGVLTLGVILGFSINDNPTGSKTNSTPTGTPLINPPAVTAAYYTDHFDGANDTTALKARGYKVWYRGGGSQGLTATWFQGNDAVFSAFEGPSTGYVGCNYNVVTGVNNIDSWLVLPGLNVGAGDTLSFYCRSVDASTFPDSFTVSYSAVGDSVPEASSWVFLGKFKASITAWERKAYLAPSAGANARFAIRYKVVNGGPLGDNSDYSGIDFLNVSTGTAGPTTCAYSYVPQTSGVTTTLYGISAVDNNVAWACGVSNVVRRTTDGGATWSSANGGGMTGTVYDIAGIDANTALATTSTASSTTIYRTSNGGVLWAPVYTASPGFINDIDMISATNGFAEGDPVANVWMVLSTTNGGLNWTPVSGTLAASAGEAGRIDNMSVFGTNIVIVGDASNVYRSSNSGANWTTTTIPGFSNGSTVTICAHLTDANNGYIASTKLLRTSNGGVNWDSVGVPGTAGFTNIEGFGTEVWTLRGSVVYYSSNRGNSWSTAYTGTGTLEDIDAVVSGGCPIGWTSSSNGTIARMNSTIVGVSSFDLEVPDGYTLTQNYPNPFNPSTNIRFAIPKSGLVTLKIYDMVGKEVATLINENKTAGNYIIGFNASNLPSGAYFYKIESNGFADTKKMLLVK